MCFLFNATILSGCLTWSCFGDHIKEHFIFSRVEVLSLVLGFESRGQIQVSRPRFEFWARIQCSWVWLNIGAYGSLFHLPKGSRSRLHNSIRLRGPSHRPSFLFSSRHPVSWTNSQRVSKNLRRLPFTNRSCLCDNWKPSFLLRLIFNWRTFSRRVTARWSRGWAKNQQAYQHQITKTCCDIWQRVVFYLIICLFQGYYLTLNCKKVPWKE